MQFQPLCKRPKETLSLVSTSERLRQQLKETTIPGKHIWKVASCQLTSYDRSSTCTDREICQRNTRAFSCRASQQPQTCQLPPTSAWLTRDSAPLSRFGWRKNQTEASRHQSAQTRDATDLSPKMANSRFSHSCTANPPSQPSWLRLFFLLTSLESTSILWDTFRKKGSILWVILRKKINSLNRI